MTQLLVGTKKGLFVLEGEAGEPFEVTSRAFAGEPVEFATRDPRSGRTASPASPPPSTGRRSSTRTISRASGSRPTGVELPEDAEKPLERLWTIVPAEDDGHLYAGGAPGVLFESHDGGATLGAEQGVLGAADAPGVEPGRGRHVHALDRDLARRPVDASRSRSRRSASGSPTTAARRGATGTRTSTRATCRRRRARTRSRSASTTCTARRSGRSGSSCSSTAASTAPTTPARAGRASPTASRPTSASRWCVDPDDPDSAYVIPLVADMDRTTPEGSVRVYETRDAGASWTTRGDGLPSDDAYLTILRQAFCGEGSGERWASTSARRRATCSARATRGRRGSRRRRSPARRCTRCAPPSRPLESGRGRGPIRIRVDAAVIRTRSTRSLAAAAGLAYTSRPVYFFDRRSICSSAPSSTSVAGAGDLDPAIGVARIDDDEREPRVALRGCAASRVPRRC